MSTIFEFAKGEVRTIQLSRGFKARADDSDCEREVTFPANLPGRYRVTIERVRAPLPDGMRWDGDCIVTPDHVVYEASCDRVLKLTKGPSLHPSIPAWVFDAFRAEGMI